jgi:hypothetical protein
MSLIIPFSCDTIGVKYQGQELELVKQDKQLNWDRSPVLITTAEKQTMHFQRVTEVMKGKLKSPSEMANLPANALCDQVDRIDELFKESQEQYLKKLKKASQRDLNNLKILKNKNRGKWLICAFFTGVIGSSLGATSGSVFRLLGTIPGAKIGSISGFIGGAIAANKMLTTYRLRQGCAHRIKWMQAIDILERKRLKETLVIIRQSGRALLEEIKELEQDNEISIDKIKELHQLLLIHQVLFPKIFFTIQGTRVDTYLNQLIIKYKQFENLIT